MIVIQNRDGGCLIGPFDMEEDADRHIKLMPFPCDWEVMTMAAPDWDDLVEEE